MKRLRLTAIDWDQVYSLLLDLSERIKRNGFKPDIIVGIARGGWLPARVISDLLGNPNLASIKVDFYLDLNETDKKPIITQQVSIPVKGKRVLIVDDVVDSGRSMRLVWDRLSLDAVDVRTAAIYYKPWSCFKPDVYSKETDSWIIFPWEYRETVKKLGKRLLDKGASLRVVKRKLVEIGLKEALVKKFVEEIYGENGND